MNGDSSDKDDTSPKNNQTRTGTTQLTPTGAAFADGTSLTTRLFQARTIQSSKLLVSHQFSAQSKSDCNCPHYYRGDFRLPFLNVL